MASRYSIVAPDLADDLALDFDARSRQQVASEGRMIGNQLDAILADIAYSLECDLFVVDQGDDDVATGGMPLALYDEGLAAGEARGRAAYASSRAGDLFP